MMVRNVSLLTIINRLHVGVKILPYSWYWKYGINVGISVGFTFI